MLLIDLILPSCDHPLKHSTFMWEISADIRVNPNGFAKVNWIDLYGQYTMNIDAERLNQLFKLDVQSLLRTVTNLESQVAELAKQESVPPWATELVARINALEESSGDGTRQTKYNIQDRKVRDGITIQELSQEESVIEKIRFEYDNAIKSLKNNLELKLTSLNIEIDRAYKLLQSRPTTSELQEVVLTTQEIDRKVQDTLSTIPNYVKTSVQELMTTEMVGLIYQLKLNESLNQKSIEDVLSQVTSTGKDYEELRKGIETFNNQVETVLGTVQKDIIVVNETMATVNRRVDDDFNRLKKQIGDLDFNHENAQDAFSDYRATISRKVCIISVLLMI